MNAAVTTGSQKDRVPAKDALIGRRWLVSSPHDAFLWRRTLDRSAEIAALIAEVSTTIPAVDALLADLFSACFRSDVRWRPEPPFDSSVAAHREIIARVLAAPSYIRLHQTIADDVFESTFVATAIVRAVATTIGDEVAGLLAADAAYAEEKSSTELEMEAIEAALETRARPRKRTGNEGGPKRPEEMNAAERRTRLVELREKVETIERDRRLDYRLLRLRAELPAYIDEVDIASQVTDIADGLSRFSAALSTWGDDLSTIERTGLDSRLSLFRRLLEDPSLRRVTELLGRTRMRASTAHRSLTRAAPIALAGTTYGNDLSRVLLPELSLASDPAGEIEFLRRYAEHELEIYDLVMVGSAARGSLVICIDESSSMAGERDETAKTLAVAIAGIARSDGRDTSLIEFAGHNVLRRLDFPAKSTDIETVVDALTHLFGGGTDFDGPLLAALDIIENDPMHARSDIIFITDGEAMIHRDIVERINRARDNGSVRLFVICAGVDASPFIPLAETIWPVADLLTGSSSDPLIDALVASIH